VSPSRFVAGRRTRVAVAALVATACVLSLQGPALGAAAPADYFYAANAQWGFDRIKTLSAWNESRGSGAVVGLVDTGVDLGHVDLQGKIVAGIDYVDGGAPDDNQGHGTLMAGIVGAATNNKDANGAGIGIAAIAPEARILPVRWVKREGDGLVGDPTEAASGIRWAVDHGASVVVLGWDWPDGQGSMPSVRSVYGRSAVQDAIRYASERGAVVVLASGNNGYAEPAYNPDLPGVVVVGSSTQQDGLPSNANGGADILAPGQNIVSTFWDPKGSFPCPNHAADCPSDQRAYESIYGVGDGTSLGAAHVAGVAALMVSKGGMTNAQIVDKLIASGETLGPYKLLDAAGALGTVVTPVTPPTTPGPTQSPPVLVQNPTSTSSPKVTRPKPKAIKSAGTPATQPATPDPGTSQPPAPPTTVTTDVTPRTPDRTSSSSGEPLNGTGVILASGLNIVAGAIDYTGGLLKQVELWQGVAALGLLVMAFEWSRWAVRRRQVRAGGAPKRSGRNDILP
jgi:serine protease